MYTFAASSLHLTLPVAGAREVLGGAVPRRHRVPPRPARREAGAAGIA